jgi:hypothetical protein
MLRFSVGKAEESRPLGRPRTRWEILKYTFQKVGWEGVNKIYLAQDRDRWRALVNVVMNPRSSTKCGEFFFD